MFTPITLPWQEPLAFAPLLDNFQHAALLYSGTEQDSAAYSYLCLGADDIIHGNQLSSLHSAISTDGQWYEPFWVGWLGYGLKNQLEQLPQDAPGNFHSDDIYFMRPGTIYRFDHQQKLVELIGEHRLEGIWSNPPAPSTVPARILSLTSNMTKAEYLAHVETILEHIRAGTCYQANLTRKFFGQLMPPISPSSLFSELSRISPAAYSGLLRADELSVISSSPELFLHIDGDGRIHTKPIKGTVRRSANSDTDAALKKKLAHSDKDRAENLMIVDLMRNDLSRVCVPGSINVEQLFDITTHAHIHHMSSEIGGRLKAGTHPLDAITACFPPGSMTGAPKFKAMEICSQLEKERRGIYSGALGWFGGNGSAHSSVVIRTLILNGSHFEFQVGGGIVYDSKPLAEWEETLHKAKGLCHILGISDSQMQAL